MVSKSDKGLLESLASILGCTYLSDLHSLDRTSCKILKAQIAKIPAEQYETRIWKDAVKYLTRKIPGEEDSETLKSMLIHEKWC